MLCRVSLQILPELIAERVLVTDPCIAAYGEMTFRRFRPVFRVQHIAHAAPCPARQHQIIIGKPGVLTEANHHDPFAVLGHEIGGINDPGVQRIAQLFGQLAPDHVKRAALVMAFEVLDVLQQERRRAVVHQNTQHVEEQRALGFILKSVQPPEGILLGHARDGKRLTGEACDQYIMLRNLSSFDFADIARDRPIVREVGVISLLGKSVPFRSKDAAPARAGHCLAQTADSGE